MENRSVENDVVGNRHVDGMSSGHRLVFLSPILFPVLGAFAAGQGPEPFVACILLCFVGFGFARFLVSRRPIAITQRGAHLRLFYATLRWSLLGGLSRARQIDVALGSVDVEDHRQARELDAVKVTFLVQGQPTRMMVRQGRNATELDAILRDRSGLNSGDDSVCASSAAGGSFSIGPVALVVELPPAYVAIVILGTIFVVWGGWNLPLSVLWAVPFGLCIIVAAVVRFLDRHLAETLGSTISACLAGASVIAIQVWLPSFELLYLGLCLLSLPLAIPARRSTPSSDDRNS